MKIESGMMCISGIFTKRGSMLDVNVLHRKIKEMSKRVMSPRPLLIVNSIADEMNISREQLMPALTELKNLRLVQFNEPGQVSVKLTLLGQTIQR